MKKYLQIAVPCLLAFFIGIFVQYYLDRPEMDMMADALVRLEYGRLSARLGYIRGYQDGMHMDKINLDQFEPGEWLKSNVTSQPASRPVELSVHRHP